MKGFLFFSWTVIRLAIVMWFQVLDSREARKRLYIYADAKKMCRVATRDRFMKGYIRSTLQTAAR